ncbi:MAG: helix-turn-helix domain-containing protein [Clostridia bacterium]|nr:helix-turn-helix domain-containing protein [Clostridia bacterium]
MDSTYIEPYLGEYDYRISKDNIYHPLRYGKHSLYQIGRMHCNKHTEIPIHTQLNYIELTVANDGKAKVVTNGNSIEIKAGDVYISFPGDFHEIIVDEIFPLKYDYITVMTDDNILLGEIDEIIASCHEARARVTRDEHIRRLVARAINEINAPDRFTDTVMESLINQILISVIRDYKSRIPNFEVDNVNDAELLCLRLMNYIDNHIYTIKNLKELTDISNYSYNYMSNLFKRVTSDTLMNYYQNRRLETAMLLLQSGQFSVTQIAVMLNYSSIYSFSLAFKRRYGYSPSAMKA